MNYYSKKAAANAAFLEYMKHSISDYYKKRRFRVNVFCEQ